ncbi:putative metallo-beta-lactamase [Gottschalkia acidurici 9a]|uniref:Metallo-beta-lactamase n=1 Tax=Gottschalkia acidurici (strain ATCC 7906 / DSM 604 / BCRC 14475 / CIP 104303 / KCTC 5404 / NCIMB 10678 / 9a) TaxID=1128398 RepID=K0B2P1_GOTA9|nr:CD3324 family protein [Gottschalkia acidurici]AFS79764.1 putative metallo-beta-lactamase [Gottschalkia acidurici 9a]
MSYIKAQDIFPKEILDLIQGYIEGEYVYIPKKEGNRKKWGETTSTREEIKIRNKAIYEEYNRGIDKKSLSIKYFLSKKSIERIILHEKRK